MSQIGALFGGLFGDPGANFVDEQGGPDAVFGTKPDVAPFKPTNLSDETGKALAGNLANFDLMTTYLDKIAPGFSKALGLGLENTFSELQGHLPKDVAEEIGRTDAFKSLLGGFGGTPMAHALTARDLGLTSLNLTQLGTNSFQQWANAAEQAYSPFTVSTSQQAAVTAADNAGEQATKQLKFNIDAGPDPGALGIFNVDAALGQQMLSFGMSSLGGIGGGGGSSAQAPVTQYGIAGGQGSAPAYQWDPYTQQYTAPVPRATPAGAWSDRRLKRDYFIVGRSATGVNVYEFEYDKPEGQASLRFRGGMADEIALIAPDAVIEIDGYFAVNYDELDIKLEALV